MQILQTQGRSLVPGCFAQSIETPQAKAHWGRTEAAEVAQTAAQVVVAAIPEPQWERRMPTLLTQQQHS